jgi:hypothetical protein
LLSEEFWITSPPSASSVFVSSSIAKTSSSIAISSSTSLMEALSELANATPADNKTSEIKINEINNLFD